MAKDYPAGQKWPQHPDDDLGDDLSVVESLQELNFGQMDGSAAMTDETAIKLEKDDLQCQRWVFFVNCLVHFGLFWIKCLHTYDRKVKVSLS